MGISNKKAVSQAKDEVRKVYEQELREQETGEALSDQISEASDENEGSQESPSVSGNSRSRTSTAESVNERNGRRQQYRYRRSDA